MTQSRPLSQSELKRLVARAALDYVESGAVLGVGTGSTVDPVSYTHLTLPTKHAV